MSTTTDDTGVVASPSESRPPKRSGPSGLAILAIAASVLALVFGILGLVLPGNGKGSTDVTLPPVIDETPQVFEIELGDLYVKPSVVEVIPNKVVVLKVTNASTAMDHDLRLNGTLGTKMLKPGESEEVNIGPVVDGDEAWCTVPGHKAAGMVMTFKIPGSENSGNGGGGAAPAPDNNAKWDANADPGPDWKPFDPELQPALTGTTHDIQFDVIEQPMEVAPGVIQQMWTFNGTVPGPTIRAKIGDVINVTLTNKGTLGHSIDFHASQVAPNKLMKTIMPGESLVYQFKAEYAGIWMYHCGTAPTLHHIGNGMFGAVVIDPPNLAPVDKEFIFVQSEQYFGPEGEEMSLEKMVSEDFDTVVFNGYPNQYVHAPIKAETGKRYRAWIVDDGPSENSSFHIVGTIFDTVFKEGTYLLQPGNDTNGGSQALDLQPAQGGFVEWEFAEDGTYTMVTHKFSNVGKGAAGVFAVGDVEVTGMGH